MKTCTNLQCKQVNPQKFAAFSKRKASKDGLSLKCRSCFKNYYEKNKKTILAKHSNWHKRNKEWVSEYSSNYRKEHIEEISTREMVYRTTNPDKVNAQNAKRRARKLQATPPWLTKEHSRQIFAIYKLAKNAKKYFGTAVHVDHIVPLCGKEVCGLHVPWNLQVISAYENISKGNRIK